MEIYKASYLNSAGIREVLYFRAKSCQSATKVAGGKKGCGRAKEKSGAMNRMELASVEFVGNLEN